MVMLAKPVESLLLRWDTLSSELLDLALVQTWPFWKKRKWNIRWDLSFRLFLCLSPLFTVISVYEISKLVCLFCLGRHNFVASNYHSKQEKKSEFLFFLISCHASISSFSFLYLFSLLFSYFLFFFLFLPAITKIFPLSLRSRNLNGDLIVWL